LLTKVCQQFTTSTAPSGSFVPSVRSSSLDPARHWLTQNQTNNNMSGPIPAPSYSVRNISQCAALDRTEAPADTAAQQETSMNNFSASTPPPPVCSAVRTRTVELCTDQLYDSLAQAPSPLPPVRALLATCAQPQTSQNSILNSSHNSSTATRLPPWLLLLLPSPYGFYKQTFAKGFR
jgi:hypothetical protein